MLFACIYVPEFALEAALRAEPDLRVCAVALLEGTPPLLTVQAVNAAAREMGLETGMSRMHAEAASGVVLRRRSAEKEAAAHAALLDAAQSFSPRVEDAAADTMLLDAGGLEHLFGPPPRMARDLASRVAALGLEANVAVAANIESALHAARGFPGVTVIPPGKERQRLGELPLEVLAASFKPSVETQHAASLQQRRDFAEILETLDRWGVRNLRALAALPEIALAERLGQDGLRLQRWARGEGERTLVPSDAPLEFEEAMELEYPLESLESLAFLLARMLEHLCARLQARALATNELRLRLQLEAADQELQVSGFKFQEEGPQGLKPGNIVAANSARLKPCPDTNLRGDGNAVAHDRDSATDDSEITNLKSEISFVSPCLRGGFLERVIRLPLPMQDAKTFLKLLQLELQAHPPPAAILKMWLRAEAARPRAAQGGLFLPTAPAPERLEITLARLKGVVGEERVGATEVLDTHRPDAIRMLRFAPHAVPSRESQVASEEVVRRASCAVRNPKLAFRRFRPPINTAVEVREGVPVALCFGGAKFRVTAASGPWRGSGDWWEGERAWQRDEWDVEVETSDGRALYRVVRDGGGKWFVEGSYD
jgi:nucleotidyltransferase/DNA polymerase involved in DNA repair